jgi:hypothetical protein
MKMQEQYEWDKSGKTTQNHPLIEAQKCPGTCKLAVSDWDWRVEALSRWMLRRNGVEDSVLTGLQWVQYLAIIGSGYPRTAKRSFPRRSSPASIITLLGSTKRSQVGTQLKFQRIQSAQANKIMLSRWRRLTSIEVRQNHNAIYNRFRSVSGIFLLILVSQLGPRPPLLYIHTLFICKLSFNQLKTIIVV